MNGVCMAWDGRKERLQEERKGFPAQWQVRAWFPQDPNFHHERDNCMCWLRHLAATARMIRDFRLQGEFQQGLCGKFLRQRQLHQGAVQASGFLSLRLLIALCKIRGYGVEGSYSLRLRSAEMDTGSLMKAGSVHGKCWSWRPQSCWVVLPDSSAEDFWDGCLQPLARANPSQGPLFDPPLSLLHNGAGLGPSKSALNHRRIKQDSDGSRREAQGVQQRFDHHR